MTKPARDKDVVADVLVVVAAVLVMGLSLLATQSPRADEAAGRPDPALVHEIELRAISQTASERLPQEVQDQIGLTGQPLATRKGVLEDVRQRLSLLPPSDELTLVWIALAAAWREDELARNAISGLAATPSKLETYRFELDELTKLSGGLPGADLPRLEQRLRDLGTSRWLVGLVRARSLANAGSADAHAALDAEMGEIAQSVATRHAVFFGLGLGLIALGSLLFFAFPHWIRPQLVKRGLVQDLALSPFRLDRTRRVVLGWFAGAYLSGYLVGFLIVALTGAALMVQPVAGLASGVIALALIQAWGRNDNDNAPLSSVLGLTSANPGHLPAKVLWLTLGVIPALAVCAAATWAFEVINQTLIGAPPETQSSIKQLLSSGDDLALVMLAVSAVIIAPLVEEIIFRGFLYRNLRDGVGKGLAIVISGVIFSAVHMHPTLFLPLAGLGIGLALLYEWTGSLWVPILAHMAFNLLTLIRIEAIWRI